MTVGELRKALASLPDDMPLAYNEAGYTFLAEFDSNAFEVIEMAPAQDGHARPTANPVHVSGWTGARTNWTFDMSKAFNALLIP